MATGQLVVPLISVSDRNATAGFPPAIVVGGPGLFGDDSDASYVELTDENQTYLLSQTGPAAPSLPVGATVTVGMSVRWSVPEDHDPVVFIEYWPSMQAFLDSTPTSSFTETWRGAYQTDDAIVAAASGFQWTNLLHLGSGSINFNPTLSADIQAVVTGQGVITFSGIGLPGTRVSEVRIVVNWQTAGVDFDLSGLHGPGRTCFWRA